MRKFFKFFTSSKFVLFFTFIINVIIFALMVALIGYYSYLIISIASLIVSLIVMSRSTDEPAYKLTWLLVIIMLPLFGAVLYLYLKSGKMSRKMKKKWRAIATENNDYLIQNSSVYEKATQKHNIYKNQISYLGNSAGAIVYENSQVKYLKNGETFFANFFEDLEKAKKNIFLEYFIIKPGKIWDKTYEILTKKIKQGVKVYILYDDFGCIDRFPRKYLKNLNKQGFICKEFNKCRPTLDRFNNYRDHRKIAIIDNAVAYTGGINIGDEYANIVDKFGYWKDTGVRIEGDAVWSFIVLFANNWELATKEVLPISSMHSTIGGIKSYGYIQPYATGPLSNEPVARNNYIRMINSAQKSVCITSPYFIIDGAMISALKLCARSGVDVKIILPGKPDKKLIYKIGRSYYEELINAGIKIYEYTPGFNHAKMVIVDDIMASVGTINFDFRSLYLHFENAVMLYNNGCIEDIMDDFVDMLGKSKKITHEDLKKRKWYERLFVNILKFFAPLM